MEIVENQPFKDLNDMLNKVNRKIVNNEIIKELIKTKFIPKSFLKTKEQIKEYMPNNYSY